MRFWVGHKLKPLGLAWWGGSNLPGLMGHQAPKPPKANLSAGGGFGILASSRLRYMAASPRHGCRLGVLSNFDDRRLGRGMSMSVCHQPLLVPVSKTFELLCKNQLSGGPRTLGDIFFAAKNLRTPKTQCQYYIKEGLQSDHMQTGGGGGCWFLDGCHAGAGVFSSKSPNSKRSEEALWRAQLS